MSSLAAALAYDNEDVIGAFHDKYAVSLDDSRAFFTEVKKWLWLCAGARCAARPLPVFDSMTWLDEMWHTFILFTLDYSRYCDEHFGFYLHHAPTGQAEQARYRARVESEPDAVRAEQLVEQRALMRLVYDTFGELTLRRWFDEYPARYAEATGSARTRVRTAAGRGVR